MGLAHYKQPTAIQNYAGAACFTPTPEANYVQLQGGLTKDDSLKTQLIVT